MNTIQPGWFAVLDAKKIKQNKSLSIKIFSHEFVLWRKSNGEIIAMDDKCPHRSAKLSLGEIKNDKIACPFHGFQFSEKGDCQFAPEFNCALPSLKTKTYPCQEKFNIIWIWLHNSIPNFEIPITQELNLNMPYSQITAAWNSDITRCVENQLDYTHLPFVHKSTIGRGFNLLKKRQVKSSDNKIEIFLDQKNSTPNIQFFYPNIWVNYISPQFYLFLYFVPIEEGKTILNLRTYQSYVTIPILRRIFGWISNLINFVILNQDKNVVASQGNKPSINAKEETLMENDLAIKHFRKYWSGNNS